ncbi:MAG: acetyl-CoA carboxylase biotin carboxylase subunit [Cyclobacteriaceae bacterium]|jgi:propionyl-CoA carboxylase alpha chain
MAKIKKILVANRGEIALRIMRSAKEMGILTVAVYSEPDKSALHVRYADQAIHIGEAASSLSYLVMDKIIAACKTTGADAIHPGYGFLSENAAFAKRVAEEGLIFIGPSAHAIEVMGDKLTSKNAVKAFDVPLVPGMEEPISDVAVAKEIAEKIGYPIMIKASAGGGGKGMRIVENPEDFESQMERAVSEAKNSFSDDSVFIEKFINNPKHIEVQILGDQHGNILYVFERECSIQRRNQKVIEEAPSPVVTDEVRKKLGEAAVNVARSVNYYGAGTVEFIADDQQNFYFLEMNTRLQVEHPVTEMISGLDLVKEQIKIAEGQPLAIKQNELKINGHSIEVRVYAEDPENNFLPDTGSLHQYVRPQGLGVRVDDGYEEGMDIPIYYDPMIAKLIVHGKDRDEAISRMKRAIDEYKIAGIKTTLPFCSFVLNHPTFIDGSFTTKFVEKYYEPEKFASSMTEDYQKVAAIFVATMEKAQKINFSANKSSKAWKRRLNEA